MLKNGEGMANSDLIGSLVRAMEILKMIGNSPSGCRVEEMCAALQLKAPTVYNILRTLSSEEFVERRNGYFCLGREFRRLAGCMENGLLEDAAETELLALYQRMPKGTAIFGIATRQGVEQTLRISFDRPGVIQTLPNELMHPYATAAGLIGLAFADEESFLQQSEKWPFAEFGAHLWKSRAKLDAFLAQVRKEKLALSPFDRDLFWRLSGAITDKDDRLYAVVGVSVPAVHLNAEMEKMVTKEVCRSAKSLTRVLRERL